MAYKFSSGYRFASTDEKGVIVRHKMRPGDEVPSFLDKATLKDLLSRGIIEKVAEEPKAETK